MMNRICYLDCLRGIVMLMVVFCHVCGFSLDCQEDLWICHIFGIIMLPGFFFVSGWFSRICLNGGGNREPTGIHAFANNIHVSSLCVCLLGKSRQAGVLLA